MKRLIEVCEEYSIGPEVVQKFILQEWIVPFDEEAMLFDHEDMARIALIKELQQEMGVNDDSIIIILDLIDRLTFVTNTIKG